MFQIIRISNAVLLSRSALSQMISECLVRPIKSKRTMVRRVADVIVRLGAD
jgi:hypothetical protein